MFPVGVVTFYQLNLLFLIAGLTAGILLIITILMMLSKRRLKADNVYLKTKNRELKRGFEAQALSEEQITMLTKKVLQNVLEILKDNQ